MEEQDKQRRDGGVQGYFWWALASSAQATAGVMSYRKGHNGDSHFMPFRAFAVASLFIGAGATAVAACLNATGIKKVDDLKELGSNIRNSMGVPPRKTKA